MVLFCLSRNGIPPTLLSTLGNFIRIPCEVLFTSQSKLSYPEAPGSPAAAQEALDTGETKLQPCSTSVFALSTSWLPLCNMKMRVPSVWQGEGCTAVLAAHSLLYHLGLCAFEKCNFFPTLIYPSVIHTTVSHRNLIFIWHMHFRRKQPLLSFFQLLQMSA